MKLAIPPKPVGKDTAPRRPSGATERLPAQAPIAMRPRSKAAFTMVEIALCLGIIAFALVAIIGVLPTGLEVQKRNREETIINQDGMLLLEAIRSGARGMDDLTNFIESITITLAGPNNAPRTFTYTNSPNPGPFMRLTNAQQIVGLLTTPKYLPMNGRTGAPDSTAGAVVNHVTARVKAMTGRASEKSKEADDLAFRYLATVEITPEMKTPLQSASLGTLNGAGAVVARYQNGMLTYYNSAPVGAVFNEDAAQAAALLNTLFEVRLTLRWPVFDRGGQTATGRGRRTFRTLVSGEIRPLSPFAPYNRLFFFRPGAINNPD